MEMYLVYIVEVKKEFSCSTYVAFRARNIHESTKNNGMILLKHTMSPSLNKKFSIHSIGSELLILDREHTHTHIATVKHTYAILSMQ